MKKRVLSLILAAALILGCIPTTFAVDTVSSGSGSTVKGPLSLGESSNVTGNLLEGSGTSIEKTDNDGSQTSGEELTKFERSEWTPFSESEAAVSYEADDVVTFIVVTEDKPQLELYSVSEIAAQTASVQSYAKRQTSTLNTVKNKVKSAFGKEKDFAIGFTYTVATTGFSVTTAYGNKAEIEAMDGVKSVYVAPTFSLPEDGMDTDYSPYTNNASTMIGANVLNETGYTARACASPSWTPASIWTTPILRLCLLMCWWIP